MYQLEGWHMVTRARRLTTADAEVAKRIRSLRHRAGLSQEQVAEALGLTFQQVQKYENGTNRITSGRLVALAMLFKVPVAAFFGQDNRGADIIIDTQLDTAVRHQIVRALVDLQSPELESVLRDVLVVLIKLIG
jgi:transcriptional regulator with XRE-family HTH domain